MHKQALLLLRSYGDFVVAMTTYSRCMEADTHVTIYASAHFRPLFKELSDRCKTNQVNLPQVQFVELGIRHHILAAFTNRHLFSHESFGELRSVRVAFKKLTTVHSIIWLEQKKRRWLFDLFAGISTRYVHDGKRNIYEAYADFWRSGSVLGSNPLAKEIRKELILPGSRKQEKQLPKYLVEDICKEATNNGREIVVAGLAQEISQYNMPVMYVYSFGELITLIQENDFIHCADSVAAHLCELFQRPHRVYYAKAINLPWVTPHGEAVLI